VALFIMLLRKMAKNRWLELSLLTGLVITVGLASSMPIYTGSILQRMLLKDLEASQTVNRIYPGAYSASATVLNYRPEDQAGQVKEADRYMEEEVLPRLGMPVQTYTVQRETLTLPALPADPQKADPNVKRLASIAALSGMENYIELVDGRLPSKEKKDGVYEALVTEDALNGLKMVIGTEFVFRDQSIKGEVRVVPVGVIRYKDEQGLYWNFQENKLEQQFLIPYELFEENFTKEGVMRVQFMIWRANLDYAGLKINYAEVPLEIRVNHAKFLSGTFGTSYVSMAAEPVLKTYNGKESKLRLMLWSLNVPVLIMLGFYLLLVANLTVGRQKNEIAVLRSRGAGRIQLMGVYAAEALLLGAIAMGIGPFLGLYIAKALGASNGFLEFVQRAKLDASLTAEAYRYAGIAAVCSVVMLLVPVFLATRTTIVSHKVQLARVRTLSLAHKFGLDAILLGISVYGIYSFRRRTEDLQALGLNSMDFKVDPLLFAVPAIFILGFSLLLLRIYPLAIRLLYRIGRKWWSPPAYSALIQVGRSATGYQFIMLFLAMTMATGLFGASAARTINQNAEDQIRYRNGADLVLMAKWENDAPPQSDGEEKSSEVNTSKRVQYSEPPFIPFTELPGIEGTARVFSRKGDLVEKSSNAEVTIMGIESDDFGRTSWMRDRLLDHHFYDYLNVIAQDPAAVLISRSIAEEFKVQPGDSLSVRWDGTAYATVQVYGIVDYWPTWNPNPQQAAGQTQTPQAGNVNKPVKPKLVVGNLSYLESTLAMEPYHVWLKLKPDASLQEIYKSIEEKKIPLVSVVNTAQDVSDSRKDPFRLALNGAMTLGFIISAGICLIGFLLYWLLSFSGRTLQYGIYRAMGITLPQLVGMIALELLLTSGAAVVIGGITGAVTGKLFVPFFQLSFNFSDQALPFQVIFKAADELRLYTVVSAMVAFGLAVLGFMLSRLRIHQAVKLGED
jgi:putative ABC transport system permease protein